MGSTAIAQVSADAMLAKSREELLRVAGYQVQTFTSLDDLRLNCNQRFDLLIIGHSLEYRSMGDVARAFKQNNPRAPILQLVATSQECSDADILFDIYKGPDELLELIKHVVESGSFRQKGL